MSSKLSLVEERKIKNNFNKPRRNVIFRPQVWARESHSKVYAVQKDSNTTKHSGVFLVSLFVFLAIDFNLILRNHTL